MSSSKLYYNITIINTDNTQFSNSATFRAHLGQELLNKPDNYRMIVNKFTMDTEGIPVAVMEIKNPQTPKIVDWETIHNIYMVDSSGNVVCSNVKFNPSDIPNHAPKPVKIVNGLGYYDNKNPYFFVYSYRYILQSINDALSVAFNQLFPSSTEFSPHFIFDPTTQLITLYVPISLFQFGNPNIAKIYFSISLNKFVGEAFSCRFVEKNLISGINENTFSIDMIKVSK